MKRKIISVQVLRGLAAFGVVLFHVAHIERKFSGGDRLLPGFFRFGQCGVDLFFVISGFVLATIRFAGKETGPGDFFSHRFSRIYPNYWFYFVITLIVFRINPAWVEAIPGEPVNLLRSFFLFPAASMPLGMVAWSLVFEIFFYGVFGLLLVFARSPRRTIAALAVWLGVLLLLQFFPAPGVDEPMLRMMASPYGIEFILGALAAGILRTGFRNLPGKVLGIFVVLSLVSLPFLWFCFYSRDGVHGLFRQCITLGPAFAILVLSGAAFEFRVQPVFPGVLVGLGNISYSLYLSHLLVLTAIGHVWSLFARPDNLLDNGVAIAAMILATVTAASVASRQIEWPSYRFFLRLTGR